MSLNQVTTFKAYTQGKNGISCRTVNLKCDGNTLDVLNKKGGLVISVKCSDITSVTRGKSEFLVGLDDAASGADDACCLSVAGVTTHQVRFDLEAKDSATAEAWCNGLSEYCRLSEDAFSNESRRSRAPSEKKSGGVAKMMHGGVTLSAHFEGKASQTVQVRVTQQEFIVSKSDGRNIFSFPLETICDVYVGAFSPVLKEKAGLDNATVFTIISSHADGFTLHLSANSSEEASKWLDGLKQALQSVSNEIETQVHKVNG